MKRLRAGLDSERPGTKHCMWYKGDDLPPGFRGFARESRSPKTKGSVVPEFSRDPYRVFFLIIKNCAVELAFAMFGTSQRGAPDEKMRAAKPTSNVRPLLHIRVGAQRIPTHEGYLA